MNINCDPQPLIVFFSENSDGKCIATLSFWDMQDLEHSIPREIAKLILDNPSLTRLYNMSYRVGNKFEGSVTIDESGNVTLLDKKATREEMAQLRDNIERIRS